MSRIKFSEKRSPGVATMESYCVRGYAVISLNSVRNFLVGNCGAKIQYLFLITIHFTDSKAGFTDSKTKNPSLGD